MQFSANINISAANVGGRKRRCRGRSVSPLRRDALHCPPHQRVGLEDSVEVVDREGEQVTIRLCPHTDKKKTDLTNLMGRIFESRLI